MKYYYLSLLFVVISTTCLAQHEEAKGNIDWGWGNNGAPTIDWCKQEKFQNGEIRGSRTPRQCLEKAIQEARAGNRQVALKWILCTQCHNVNAYNSINRMGLAAVDYLMQKYGGEAAPSTNHEATKCEFILSNNRNSYIDVYGFTFKVGSSWFNVCESLQHLKTMEPGSKLTITFNKGYDIYIVIKRPWSNPCDRVDLLYELRGLGDFQEKRSFDVL
ncbi:hypothetical protein [Chitinophaga caseinilytica]|uniref:hypothetical protein n=1 Tax=Chitinophaga caseinilytica TaxID=2267521 RepID=UPI003C2BA4F6